MIDVADHALDRARERRIVEPYRLHRDVLRARWRRGVIELWRDPNDPVGCVTATSYLDDGVLVGRLHRATGKITIISALTVGQYENNARSRWGEP